MDARAERDALVENHLSLVAQIARKMQGRVPLHVSYEDLFAAGIDGLLNAATHFEPETGVPFGAFAKFRIHGAMVDYVRGLDNLSRGHRRFFRQAEDAQHILQQQLGREPGEDEVAFYLSVFD